MLIQLINHGRGKGRVDISVSTARLQLTALSITSHHSKARLLSLFPCPDTVSRMKSVFQEVVCVDNTPLL